MDDPEANECEVEDIGDSEVLFRPILDLDYDHEAQLIKNGGIPFKMKRGSSQWSEESADWKRYCPTAREAIDKRDASTRHRYGAVRFIAGEITNDAPLDVRHSPDGGRDGLDCAHASILLTMDQPKEGEESTLWRLARTEARQRLNDRHLVVEEIPPPADDDD